MTRKCEIYWALICAAKAVIRRRLTEREQELVILHFEGASGAAAARVAQAIAGGCRVSISDIRARRGADQYVDRVLESVEDALEQGLSRG